MSSSSNNTSDPTTVEENPSSLLKLFNAVELRGFVLASLGLQVILIATGTRRKYTRRKRIAATLWVSYLLADYIATTALGFLSKAREHGDPRDPIMAFWAPFLLMHLGGPDSITAYAMADNELWLRHALGLAGQLSVALYILYRSWTWTPINYLGILIFVAGLIKYGERTWVLFCASRDQFHESMVTPPDPGPNYAKFSDEMVSREMEGYRVSMEIFASSSVAAPPNPAANIAQELIPDAVVLHEAYYFFKTFKRLFADLILTFQDREASLSFFREQSWDKAFDIVEVELGLVYDLFYTKATLLHTPHGFFLRLVSFLSTVVSLIVFVFIHLNVYPKFKVKVNESVVSVKTEVIITYILLAGAVLLEIYAILILFSSDMMMIWLSGEWTNVGNLLTTFKKPIVWLICKPVSLLRCLHIVPSEMRWSNVMGQYSVLTSCFESKPKCAKLHDFLEKKYFFWKSASVPKGLKALIFNEVKNRARTNNNKSPSYWTDEILVQEMNSFGDKDEDRDVEFDRSLLLWHMATDFCYYNDVGENHEPDKTLLLDFILTNNDDQDPGDVIKFKREICKLLSDYMMHLLIMSPFMLPSGLGKIRFQDSRAEALEFFKEMNLSEVEACEKLLEVDTQLPPSKVKGDRSKSLLYDACRLTGSLGKRQEGDMWQKITEAWLDILTYAAAQCSWSDHAEKLSQGGELLTHVWLLMAHFGMTDQFQISQGYVRAKLNAK